MMISVVSISLHIIGADTSPVARAAGNPPAPTRAGGARRRRRRDRGPTDADAGAKRPGLQWTPTPDRGVPGTHGHRRRGHSSSYGQHRCLGGRKATEAASTTKAPTRHDTTPRPRHPETPN